MSVLLVDVSMAELDSFVRRVVELAYRKGLKEEARHLHAQHLEQREGLVCLTNHSAEILLRKIEKLGECENGC